MSKISQHGRFWTGMVLALAACSAAQAQSSLLSTPWYISAGVGGVLPESLRDQQPGPQGRLLVGIPLRPQAFLEASVFGLAPSGKNGQPDETSYGAGLDLKLESLGDHLNYLFLAGGGYAQAKRGSDKVNAPYANIGWGAELELAPLLAIRTELRGLVRFSDDFIPGRGVSYDGLLTVGLTKRFGRTPPPASRAAPPPPVAPYMPPPPPAAAPALPATAGLSMPLLALDLSHCPPVPAGVKADADSCLVPQRSVLARTRLFAAESARLSDTADDLLVPVVISLRRQPDLKLEMVVHTDTLGLQSQNLDLTLKMADQIHERLLQYGVPAAQIEVLGVGETEPVANEVDDAAREKNRRLELNLSR